jgi:hypothetical protein
MSRHPPSFLRRNSLSLVLFGLFVAFLAGQLVAGHHAYNEENRQEGQPPVELSEYVSTGHFQSATMENWESEFLQMGMYVLLTVWLRQKGSAESRPLDPAQEQETIEDGPTPRAAQAGGMVQWLYANSLSIAFMLLFLASFALHLSGSWRDALEQRAEHGLPPISWTEHLAGSEFWFESFQNWQSEFLAVFAIVVLSIFLRQEKSPESKPLRAPHSQTGA